MRKWSKTTQSFAIESWYLIRGRATRGRNKWRAIKVSSRIWSTSKDAYRQLPTALYKHLAPFCNVSFSSSKNVTAVILWSIDESSRARHVCKLKALSSALLGYDLIIFSSHGFKCKCKIRCFILSRHTTTVKVSTKAVKVGAMTRPRNVLLQRCNSPLQYTTPFTRLHLRGDDKRLRLG